MSGATAPTNRDVLSVDAWADDVPVPSFGPRMVCTGCGIIWADARPNWSERPMPQRSGAGTDKYELVINLKTAKTLGITDRAAGARRRGDQVTWEIAALQ